jgi:hypothetical protein
MRILYTFFVFIGVVAAMTSVAVEKQYEGVQSPPGAQPLPFVLKQEVQQYNLKSEAMSNAALQIKLQCDALQSTIESIRSLVQAPRSFLKQGSVLIRALTDFQTNSEEAAKYIPLPDIIHALASKAACEAEVKKQVTDTAQKSLGSTYNSYEKVIEVFDTIETKALLEKMNQLLDTVHILLSTALQLRQAGGGLATQVMSPEYAHSLQLVGEILQKSSKNVTTIIAYSRRTMRTSQAELARKLLSNIGNVPQLEQSIKQSIDRMPPAIAPLSGESNNIVLLKDQLLARVTDMYGTIEIGVKERLKKEDNKNTLSLIVRQEWEKDMRELGKSLVAIIKNASALAAQLSALFHIGISAIDAFKIYINFEVMTPQSRTALNELAKNIELSKPLLEQLQKMQMQP